MSGTSAIPFVLHMFSRSLSRMTRWLNDVHSKSQLFLARLFNRFLFSSKKCYKPFSKNRKKRTKCFVHKTSYTCFDRFTVFSFHWDNNLCEYIYVFVCVCLSVSNEQPMSSWDKIQTFIGVSQKTNEKLWLSQRNLSDVLFRQFPFYNMVFWLCYKVVLTFKMILCHPLTQCSCTTSNKWNNIQYYQTFNLTIATQEICAQMKNHYDKFVQRSTHENEIQIEKLKSIFK